MDYSPSGDVALEAESPGKALRETSPDFQCQIGTTKLSLRNEGDSGMCPDPGVDEPPGYSYCVPSFETMTVDASQASSCRYVDIRFVHTAYSHWIVVQAYPLIGPQISGMAEDGREMRSGDSAIMSVSGDCTGVGEVISIAVESACLNGTGEISMASCICQGDDAGIGGVVTEPRHQGEFPSENKTSYSLPRSVICVVKRARRGVGNRGLTPVSPVSSSSSDLHVPIIIIQAEVLRQIGSQTSRRR